MAVDWVTTVTRLGTRCAFGNESKYRYRQADSLAATLVASAGVKSRVMRHARIVRSRTVAALLTFAILVSACANSTAPSPPSMNTPIASSRRQPPPDASTSDASSARTPQIAHLCAVRLAPHGDHDRLVLEFTDLVPGYTIGYRPLPAQHDASGEVIPLPGAAVALHISLTSATASGWSTGERTYFGPSTVAADTTVVTEAKSAGDFEAVLTWVVGTRATAPFRVDMLHGPPRLVIDVQH
jgi:hypothetical protein